MSAKLNSARLPPSHLSLSARITLTRHGLHVSITNLDSFTVYLHSPSSRQFAWYYWRLSKTCQSITFGETVTIPTGHVRPGCIATYPEFSSGEESPKIYFGEATRKRVTVPATKLRRCNSSITDQYCQINGKLSISIELRIARKTLLKNYSVYW